MASSNELDLIRLIDLAYRAVYEPCADVDRNGVLTLAPITIGGVPYPGDLRVLSAAVYQDLICQPDCAQPSRRAIRDFPCDTAHSGSRLQRPHLLLADLRTGALLLRRPVGRLLRGNRQ